MSSPCANHDAAGGQADISVEALDLLVDDVNFFKAKSEHLLKDNNRLRSDATNIFLSFLAYFPDAKTWGDVYAGIEALEENQNITKTLHDKRATSWKKHHERTDND